MESSLHSYYTILQAVPVGIFLVLIIVLAVINECCKCLKQPIQLTRQLFQRFIEWLAEKAFSFCLKKHTDNEGKKSYRILNYDIPDKYVHYVLAITTYLLIAAGAINFWDEFLLEKSLICNIDQQFACFPSFPN